jgi:hypothetical protein
MLTKRRPRILVASALALALLGAPGCGNNPVSPGKGLQVANVPDDFQFQVTGIQNYTHTYQYTWVNTGTAASVNQASVLTAGTAVLVIRDHSGTQVYSRSVTDNGTFDTAVGATGTWTIVLSTSKATGTLNFRVQKKP